MDVREQAQPQGIMMGSFGAPALTNSPMVVPVSTGMLQGVRLFSPMDLSAPKPADATGVAYHGDALPATSQDDLLKTSDPVKKKRGRPRKYGPDGGMSLGLSPLSSPSGHSKTPTTDPSVKRRGRPPGSGKKQQLEALGSSGISFTPHVITVKGGEDVASKIMAFSQQSSRTVCIMSANGVISNVTLRQPATSGGTVSYEGRFEIISLSGSFLLTDDGGTRSRTGGLSVALVGSDGRVLGGVVAGMLLAQSPVQVVVGSFIAEGKKSKVEPSNWDPSSVPSALPAFGAPLAANLPSEGTSSESSQDPGSPINQNCDTRDNSGQGIQSAYPSIINWSLPANQA